jgi:sialidase-1
MQFNRFLIAGLVGLFTCAAHCAGESIEQKTIEQKTLFRAGEGGYNNYRIPSIILTQRKSLLAFCEGRQAPSDAGEINVLVRRSTDGGKTFSPQKIVWADGKNTCGNPCAVVDRSTGFIWLLMTHNLGEDREKEITLGTAKSTRSVWITHSENDGISWAAPRDITSQTKRPGWAWYATGPGNAIQLNNGPHAGRLIVPCDYVETGGNPDKSNSVVIYSDDHGANWRIGGEPPNHGFNESQVVELPDGAVMLNMRNIARPKGAEQKTARAISVSKDGGETFDVARWDTALPEPRCQASIIRYSWATEGKSRILFSNPALTKSRKTMTVRMSYDEGKTWPVKRVVFAGFSAYSSLVSLPDGAIGLLYEAGEKKGNERIDFARFGLDWLTEGKDQAGK